MSIERAIGLGLVQRRTTRTITCAIAIACATSASAQCQYSVKSTPNWQCAWGLTSTFTATGLNNLGAWCGYRGMCYPEEGEGQLPIYCPPNGTPQVLPMPPNAGPKGAQATAVNDAGVIVGFSFQGVSGSQEIGCIWWPDGTFTEIAPAPGATSSRAMDINNSNVVVGGSGNMPYIYHDGLMQVVDPSPLVSAGAYAISDSGWVVGVSGGGFENGKAFRYKDGVIEVLPPLGGLSGSDARGVDSKGTVVGISWSFNASQGYVALPSVWTLDGSFVLPLPAGYNQGTAVGINDNGVTIGQALAPSGSGLSQKRVVWLSGIPFDINNLTLPGSPSIGSLLKLNQAGQLLQGGGARVITPLDQLPEDINGDCAVDGSDIAKLLADWGPREWSIADIDGDGVVNGFDLGLMLGAWTGSK